MNYSLPLTPFPSQNMPVADLPHGLPADDFVDESAVVRLTASRSGAAHIPLRPRVARTPNETAVPSGATADYAGWNRPVLCELPVPAAFQVPTAILVDVRPERREIRRSSEPLVTRTAASPFIAVRAHPPMVERGLGEPVSSGGFRWWLGAAGGVVCTLVVSALLHSLASQERAPRATTAEATAPVFLTPVKLELSQPAGMDAAADPSWHDTTGNIPRPTGSHRRPLASTIAADNF